METSPHSQNIGANASTRVAHADDSPLVPNSRGRGGRGRNNEGGRRSEASIEAHEYTNQQLLAENSSRTVSGGWRFRRGS
jgi:hypothetical protein